MMRLTRLLAVAAVTVVLGHCASQPTPPPAAPAPAPKAAAAAARDAGMPEAPPYVYSYNPLAKRDPFRSLIEEVRAPSVENTVCTEPLCQWDLDQLTLVAVVTGEANPLAMVEDPGGKGYLIRRSSRVGKQGGKVTQILRDTVTVTEFWTGPDGKINPNPVTLHMKADKAVVPDVDLATGKKYP
ncbi:MAG TPA: pilus assembly protein PilP [Myxococcaceae bacterium]|nr:pilus assembly protein PilP [Myxococcaceae bacterium]